jgi:predicted  nucleic acid-binding Zn-ribbon protein
MAAEQFNFRVETELKKAFLEKARENGTTASELLVEFMQRYLGIEPKYTRAAVDTTEIDNRLSEIEERLSARIAALEEAMLGKQKRAA